MSYKRKIIGTSLEEIRFFYFIKQIFPEAINRFKLKHKYTKNAELDIFVPHLNFGIEYDGVYYHSHTYMIKRDTNKNRVCKDKNIVLLRIREKGLEKISNHDIIYDYNLKESYKYCCEEVLFFILKNLKLSNEELKNINNLNYDKFEIGAEILNLYKEIEFRSSLSSKNSNLSKEWNYEKNNGLTPDKVKPNSDLLVWWKCNDCSFEWQATIHERHRGKWGCLKCRSLGIKNPKLTKEWHPIKNNITPFEITTSSNKKVWWLCPYGTEYEMSIDNRRRLKSCPCHAMNTHNLHEYNNFNAVNTVLAKEWHQTKNGNLTPKDIFPTSLKKYWWICDKGHEYESTPHQRHYLNQGCPYCNGKKVSKENSLAQNKPGLAKQWHPTKNSELTPENVTISSGKRVWWLCNSCNYEWESNINNRVRTSGKCPNCKKN